MVFRIFSSMVLKCAPLRMFLEKNAPGKECSQFVGLILPYITTGKNYATSTKTEAIDSVQMWKYVNFVVNENPREFSHSGKLGHIVNLLENRKHLEKEMQNLESMSSESDKELQKLIETEKKQFLEAIERTNDDMLSCILSNVEEDENRNVELRFIPGIGGEEAKLFSQDLFAMYINYAEFKNWECHGDLKSGYISVFGDCVYGHLKYEAGVHRVQRVPATESSGRIHTSTCSIIVIPQPQTNEIIISEKDLIIEKIKSSGPGGQNVNKRETCIRIKHIPTGIVIENQTERYQYENLKFAIERLRGILYHNKQEKVKLETKALKREQAGTNDYSDKIRTYNFPQNRVTDHRINHSIQNLKGFLTGREELDNFIQRVREHSKRKQLIVKIKQTLDSVEYKNFEKQLTNQDMIKAQQ